MRVTWELTALALLGSASAQLTTSTVRHDSTTAARSSTSHQSSSVRASTGTLRQASSTSVSSKVGSTTVSSSIASISSPCGIISRSLAAYSSAHPTATSNPVLSPILALSCLESVPLNVQRSLAFIDYISPFIEFQSTLAYLKDPPVGYPLPGVDVFGGLEEIRNKVSRMTYTNQYEFERELHLLINTRPRDFHFNLPLPLVSLFQFDASSDFELVSISKDGTSLPDIYVLSDLVQQKNNPNLSWKPSRLVSIDLQPAGDHLLRSGLETQAWADPDAIYNLMFTSPALAQQSLGNSWVFGGHTYGFASDNTTYLFENSSIPVVRANRAFTSQDFTGINSGEALFEAVEVPSSTTNDKRSFIEKAKRATASEAATTKVAGYPDPVIIHPDGGYTAGYFLPNSTVAVLVMTAFEGKSRAGGADYVQQAVIKSFLAACRTAKKDKLIVDIQANGGGSVFNGDDAFKQIFPTIQPLGATRMRYTPLVDLISKMYSEAGVYNTTFSSVYQIQAEVDANQQDFKTYKDLVGPYEIYGDNLTAIMRVNFTDITQQVGNDVIVSGYANETDIAPQLFSADNIVLLYDGVCGSTCAIFTELMKSQGGVRSISVGGRPTTGPMQSATGSKGAQVFSYGNIQSQLLDIGELYTERNLPIPAALFTIPSQYNVSMDDPPLGGSIASSARFNLRNNYNSTAATEVPLQFIYEASNCRLYHQEADMFDITNLWKRVVDVTWGKGKCVSGSTVNKDDTMPKYAWQVKDYDAAVFSNFTLNTGLPGTVYFDETKGTAKLTSIGAAIYSFWAW